MLPRPNARDKSALFLKIFRDLLRMKNYCRIKISKSEHEQKINTPVKGLVLKKRNSILGKVCQKLCFRADKKLSYHGRKKYNRYGEYNRNHSHLINSQRKMGVRPAIHFHAAHPFCV